MGYRAFKRDNVTIIMPQQEEPDRVPKVGEKLYAYDDGKIRISREFEVEVVKVIRPWRWGHKNRKMWKEEVETCYWLYAPKTDRVIVARDLDGGAHYFVRCHDGSWFSCIESGARLDVTGELYRSVHQDEVK